MTTRAKDAPEARRTKKKTSASIKAKKRSVGKGTITVSEKGMSGWKAARSTRRLEALSHLSGAIGADVVTHLGAWSGPGLEIVRRSVQEGMPSAAVGELQKELRELNVPRPSKYVEVIASRASRARRAKLTPEEGERLVRVAGVVARALDVWEVESDAAEFLTTPHPMLGGEAPIDRARSELGARQVEDLLTKLDLGLPV